MENPSGTGVLLYSNVGLGGGFEGPSSPSSSLLLLDLLPRMLNSYPSTSAKRAEGESDAELDNIGVFFLIERGMISVAVALRAWPFALGVDCNREDGKIALL